MKISKVLLSGLILLFFSACSPNKEAKQAQVFDNAEQAEQAIAAESDQIDALIAKIREVKTDSERKNLMCEQIPAQYDKLMQSLKANQHLMQVKDEQVIEKMQSQLQEQKQKFANAAICHATQSPAASTAVAGT